MRRHDATDWASPAWREAATRWLDEQLAAAGMERAGEVEQPHVRPWATLLRAPTSHGTVWLKAATPETASEIGLYLLLRRVAPDHVLAPIAADAERGWILLPDGGPTLGDRLSGAELARRMTDALAEYGRLQRALAPQVDELLAIGAADMRPHVMPARLEEALDAVEAYGRGHMDAGDARVLARVRSLRPRFRDWCERLAAAPGAASLDHNDLHPWNVLDPAPGGSARARFYDWGDSVVAHPFACMLVPLTVQVHVLGTPPDHPDVLRLRDGYLQAFAGLAPHAELVETLELACRVAKAARALTWHRALSALGWDGAGDHARAPLECLASLLSESHIGGA